MTTRPLRLGWKASAEQFGPGELLDLALRAEAAGLDSVAISDHFQPFRHTGGHSPASLPWLGAVAARTSRLTLLTSVLTPTFRYHPSVVAHAFATLALLAPGRIVLGVGTGESLNDVPATDAEWPSGGERLRRLQEAVELMRTLWTEDRVSFEGQFFRTRLATIYDRPDEPVPIYIAAGAPRASRWAGAAGDGFITTSGKPRELYVDGLLPALAEGAAEAGRSASDMDLLMEIKVSYAPTLEEAREACRFWAPLSLPAELKQGVEDPVELERLADDPSVDATKRFICTTDPEECAARILEYVELGFRHLVFHYPGADQAAFIDRFTRDVAPLLRARAG